jgi:hypothetical protein
MMPPGRDVLAVEHARKVCFITTAGLLIAAPPIENEVARYFSVREQSHAAQTQP